MADELIPIDEDKPHEVRLHVRNGFQLGWQFTWGVIAASALAGGFSFFILIILHELLGVGPL